VTQYDVENCQKIEHLIEKKLEEYPHELDKVLTIHERVLEAERFAKTRNEGINKEIKNFEYC